jgi:hypothetical protein
MSFDSFERRGSLTKGSFLKAQDGIIKSLQKRGFVEYRLLTHWAEIIGQRYASYTLPERLTTTSDGHTLTLKVQHSIAVEIQQVRLVLIERINTYFGFKMIDQLALVQAPLKPKYRKQNIAQKILATEQKQTLSLLLQNVKTESLKNAITELATSMFGSVLSKAGQIQEKNVVKETVSWRNKAKQF